MDQWHVAKPVGEGVDTVLSLTEVLWVGPGDALCNLKGVEQDSIRVRLLMRGGCVVRRC